MWDLNEERQGRNAGFIWVAYLASQLIWAAWSCIFKKILRLDQEDQEDSDPAGKSV